VKKSDKKVSKKNVVNKKPVIKITKKAHKKPSAKKAVKKTVPRAAVHKVTKPKTAKK